MENVASASPAACVFHFISGADRRNQPGLPKTHRAQASLAQRPPPSRRLGTPIRAEAANARRFARVWHHSPELSGAIRRKHAELNSEVFGIALGKLRFYDSTGPFELHCCDPSRAQRPSQEWMRCGRLSPDSGSHLPASPSDAIRRRDAQPPEGQTQRAR